MNRLHRIFVRRLVDKVGVEMSKNCNLIARNELFWGRLDSVGLDQDGLVGVVLTGQGCLPVVAQVSMELAGNLMPLVGQEVIICHVKGRWLSVRKKA